MRNLPLNVATDSHGCNIYRNINCLFASIVWTRCDIVKIHSVGVNDMVVNIAGTPRNTNHPHATLFKNKLVMVPGTFDISSLCKSLFNDGCSLFDSLWVDIECYTRDILAGKLKRLIRWGFGYPVAFVNLPL